MDLEIVVPGLLAPWMSAVPQQLARARMFVEARRWYDALADAAFEKADALRRGGR